MVLFDGGSVPGASVKGGKVTQNKISPVLVVSVLALSLIIVLYRVFTGVDLFRIIRGGVPVLFRP
ncbi:hypothetical protein J2129_002331 [Methanofollis sp. W23]|uniref:hypothetical protein n=1 Tax=Methanofollis sp. W23 TaxID=2817849 RepID=UPI001AE18962|nr:hypothetical protein [Methanofollis sp. W23]MBP2146877.1 hypothetical protein [Methanofollis sp. W23]